MIEREEEGTWPRESDPALRTAEVAAHRDRAPIDQIHVGVTLSLGERRFQRIGDSAPGIAADDNAIEHDAQLLAREVPRGLGRLACRVGKIEDDVASLDAGEPTLEQCGERRGRILGRGPR